MNALRRTSLVLVTLFGLAAAQAQDHPAAPAAAPSPAALPHALVLGLDADADLAEAQLPPGQLAATKLPGPRPCSFVPSKNAVKPKKNACRFA